MSKAFDLSGVGQHGHKADSTPAIDGSELKAAHAYAAKLAQIDELDASDQADAHGELGKRTLTSDDLRHEIEIRDEGPTYRSEPEDSNVRDTKSGVPSNNGPAPKGGR